MQALRFHGVRDLRVEEIEEPTAGPGQVKVAVRWCGICGTDIHLYEGAVAMPASVAPHRLTGESLPITMGHEFSGEVVDVGDGVATLSIGDAVVIEPVITCGDCAACRAGRYNLCPDHGAVGIHGWGGGFSEYVVLPERMVHRLPDGIGFDVAALVEPIAVGWHGMRKAGFDADQTALVVGAGPIGLATLVCLQTAAPRLAAVSVRAEGARSAMARAFDADAVINAGRESVPEAVMDLTGGRGVDVVFETAGTQGGIDDAVAAVRRGGTIVALALWQAPGTLDFTDLVAREVTVMGSLAYANEFPAVIEALSDGRMANAERMITERVALADAVAAVERLSESKSDHVKVLVRPVPGAPAAGPHAV